MMDPCQATSLIFNDERGMFSALVDGVSAGAGYAVADPSGRVIMATVRRTIAESEAAAIEHLGLTGMDLAERGFTRCPIVAMVGSLSVYGVSAEKVDLSNSVSTGAM